MSDSFEIDDTAMAKNSVIDQIVKQTSELAATYQSRFHGDPEAELHAWLEIAARREALVREVYGARQRRVRLQVEECGAQRAAWDLLTEVWQQEAVHTTMVSGRLSDGFLKRGAGVLFARGLVAIGNIEARIFSALTRSQPSLGQALARLAVRLGSAVSPGAVPEFAREITSLNARAFFELARALELTAKQSYQRMCELITQIEQVRADRRQPLLQVEGLGRELHRAYIDEAFHEQSFEMVASWMSDEGEFDPTLDAQQCVQALAGLLPRATPTFRDTRTYVTTDGLLGAFFRRHHIDLVVVPAS